MISGCAPAVTPPPESLTKRLSELGLFTTPLANLQPAPGVLPYELNSPAYFDDTVTQRVIKLPPGKSMEYRPQGPFELPTGTLIAQTLSYPLDRRRADGPVRSMETRVMFKLPQGWMGAAYLWQEDQQEALLKVVGGSTVVEWLDAEGKVQKHTAVTPHVNGCKRCHKPSEIKFATLGFTARQLNRASTSAAGERNQLERWASQRLLTGLPAAGDRPAMAQWDVAGSGTVEQRARAWLDVNCAHCHNRLGPARNSGLYLSLDIMNPFELGVYKPPVAAGRGSGRFTYDIVPGKPDESIMTHRLRSVEPGIVMPEYGRARVDHAGLELVREWIAGLPPSLGSTPDQVGEVTELTEVAIEEISRKVDAEGDAARGESLFHRQDLNCLKCHALAGAGGAVGPDLAQWPMPPKRSQLIEAVLLPSKSVREGFATLTLHLDDGRVLAGVKTQEDEQSLVLRDPFQGDTRVPKAAIESRADGGSLMPTSVVARLRKSELYDLLAFLAAVSQHPPKPEALADHVRSWWTLTTLPADTPDAEVDHLERWIDRVDPLAWQPVYAKLSGAVDVGALVPTTAGRIVTCRFDVGSGGALGWKLSAPLAAQVWLDGKLLAVDEVATTHVSVGSHRLVVLTPSLINSGGLKLTRDTNSEGAAAVVWSRELAAPTSAL